MRQKRKKVRKAPYENLNEEELEQMRAQALAEGRPFPEGQDLNESLYSYYTEKTDLNESQNAAAYQPAAMGGVQELQIDTVDIYNQTRGRQDASNSARGNVSIFANLEGPAEMTHSPSQRNSSSSNLRNSRSPMQPNTRTPAVVSSQNVQIVSARPQTPRSGEQQQTQTVNIQRLETPPIQQAEEAAVRRHDTPRQDTPLQDTTKTSFIAVPTRKIAVGEFKQTEKVQSSMPDPGRHSITSATAAQNASADAPKGQSETAPVSTVPRRMPTPPNSGRSPALPDNTEVQNQQVGPQRQPSLKRKVTISVKPKNADARVGWNDGLVSQDLQPPMQNSKSMAVTTTNQEKNSTNVFERKQTLKRKLTISVKQDPKQDKDARVGWNYLEQKEQTNSNFETEGGVKASEAATAVATNDDNDTSSGSTMPTFMVVGAVVGIAVLAGAYMFLRRK